MEKSCKQIERLGLKKIETHLFLSREELDAIGKKFAEKLDGADIVLFFGDLGSGKTTFIRSVLSYYNVCQDEVRSPTFNIVNSYSAEKFDFFHIDAYRITSEELFEIGFYDYQNEDSIIFIEWAENIIDDIDEADFLVELSIDETDIEKRNLTLYGKE
jgi:tRNA threonylcarbamoyladenosine biosynthesis protein TsaE